MPSPPAEESYCVLIEHNFVLLNYYFIYFYFLVNTFKSISLNICDNYFMKALSSLEGNLLYYSSRFYWSKRRSEADSSTWR